MYICNSKIVFNRVGIGNYTLSAGKPWAILQTRIFIIWLSMSSEITQDGVDLHLASEEQKCHYQAIRFTVF